MLLLCFVILGVGVVSWLISVLKNDVSFVDSLWSLFFLLAAVVFAVQAQSLSAKGVLVFVLVAVWSLRLSIYISARNWGKPEDYRYQTIRENNEPGFAFKSLYIVFGLQGVLAWLIALPLLPAIASDAPLNILDFVALLLWLVGFVFEAGGDYQLAKFKSRKDSDGQVLTHRVVAIHTPPKLLRRLLYLVVIFFYSHLHQVAGGVSHRRC